MTAIATNRARIHSRSHAAVHPPLPLQIDVPGLEIGPEDTVVDIGCGDGVVCTYAGRRGAAVIGIDCCTHAMELADAAMREVPARSWQGIVSDCDPIPLADGCASVVVCTEVLEHVADPVRFLAELARVGAPGARYVISVPDPASERVIRSVAPGWYWEEPFHVRVLTHERLDALARDAGLEVIERASKGFHQSLWWTFRFAIGAKVGEPTPEHPALVHWDAAWRALATTPGGSLAADALDRALPKSQILFARKAIAGSAGRRPLSGLKRRLRDGALRLAGYDLRWSIRRAGGH